MKDDAHIKGVINWQIEEKKNHLQFIIYITLSGAFVHGQTKANSQVALAEEPYIE